MYKGLNLCFLLLPNSKSQVIDNKHLAYIVEFDELCNFCHNKKNKQWIWAVISRNTWQIVAYVIGDRSELTFKRLLRKIPLEYLKCQSFSDYGGRPVKSYAILKAKGNHRSGEPVSKLGKKAGKRIILNDTGLL